MIDEGQQKSSGGILERLDPRTANALGGFFIGLTICVFAGWFLQQIGVLYIHTKSDSFGQLKQFNDTVANVRPVVERGLRALRIAEQRVKKAMADGEDLSITEARFVNFVDLFPELAAEVASDLPRNSSIIIITSKDGGYKVLSNSYLCPAVALEMPELVDPNRSRYGLFCGYFGHWNKAGKKL